MMAPTHIVAGMALALPLVPLAPALAPAAALGGALGGVLPDLDMFVGEHRRTLHFPVAAWPLAALAGAGASLSPTPLSVGLAFAVLALAVHSVSDLLGAGPEMRPWERSNADAVYNHVQGRWHSARYLVRYDGAPEDLFVTLACAAPGVLLFQGPPRWVALGAVAVAVPYTTFRKQFADYAARLS